MEVLTECDPLALQVAPRELCQQSDKPLRIVKVYKMGETNNNNRAFPDIIKRTIRQFETGLVDGYETSVNITNKLLTIQESQVPPEKRNNFTAYKSEKRILDTANECFTKENCGILAFHFQFFEKDRVGRVQDMQFDVITDCEKIIDILDNNTPTDQELIFIFIKPPCESASDIRRIFNLQ